MEWHYEKLDEKGRVKYAPMNDADGKITGRHVFGLKAWFDENPEERKRLGWIKHIVHKPSEIDYDPTTQYLANAIKTIDPNTIEDDYRIMDKSEAQMRLAELQQGSNHSFIADESAGIFISGGDE